MTAAAPRTANGTPDLRRVAVAVGALALAVALVAAVAFIRPAGGPSATTSGHAVNGTNGGYTGIPYTPTRPAPKALPGLHGSPSGATPDDMSSAIFSAQREAAGRMSSADAAALNAAAATTATHIDMTSAAYLNHRAR